MCYMPQKKKNNLPMQQLPVMQMKDNMRNYYQTSLNSPFSKSLNIVVCDTSVICNELLQQWNNSIEKLFKLK